MFTDCPFTIQRVSNTVLEHPLLVDRCARLLTLAASAYLFVRIGMGLLSS